MAFNNNDVVICEYPKSGITWLSFMLAGIRLSASKLKCKPTFYNIDSLVNDIHQMKGYHPGKIWNDGIGNFYKSHSTPEDYPRVIYLLRRPESVLKSYYVFRKSFGINETATEFLMGPEGIPGWISHVRSWLIESSNLSLPLMLVRYEDLLLNPSKVLGDICENIGLLASTEDIDYGLKCGEISAMRASEEHFRANNPVYSKGGLNFVRKENARHAEEFNETLISQIKEITNACTSILYP